MYSAAPKGSLRYSREAHILLHRLHTRFGIDDKVLMWFQDYLSERSQSVVIMDEKSVRKSLKFGMPQGSVLGLQLFTAYSSPLADIAKDHKLCDHYYADDTQLYITLKPISPIAVETALSQIHSCLQDIKHWMQTNWLKLN